jgi:predicted nucleic acid-binding protein
MNFVIDASVVLSWCFEDEGGDYAVSVLEELVSSEAVAASLWPLEVTNGLLTAERRGRIALAEARRFARLLLSLPIVVDPVGRRRAFDATHAMARRHGLTSYDAAYLELATRLGIPLATLDGPLRAAADAEGVGAFHSSRAG